MDENSVSRTTHVRNRFLRTGRMEFTQNIRQQYLKASKHLCVQVTHSLNCNNGDITPKVQANYKYQTKNLDDNQMMNVMLKA